MDDSRLGTLRMVLDITLGVGVLLWLAYESGWFMNMRPRMETWGLRWRDWQRRERFRRVDTVVPEAEFLLENPE